MNPYNLMIIFLVLLFSYLIKPWRVFLNLHTQKTDTSLSAELQLHPWKYILCGIVLIIIVLGVGFQIGHAGSNYLVSPGGVHLILLGTFTTLGLFEAGVIFYSLLNLQKLNEIEDFVEMACNNLFVCPAAYVGYVLFDLLFIQGLPLGI